MKTLLDGVIGTFRAATSAPVAYTPMRTFFSGLINRNEQINSLDQMGNVSTLFAIINKLSTSVSSVEWHMHKVATGRAGALMCEICEEPGVEMVLDHPALVVWDRPNDFFPGQLFRETAQQHMELVGETWWVAGKMGDRPVELWPVRPDRMQPVPDPKQFLIGYLYTGPDGQMVGLDRDEVIFTRMPNPMDPYRGMGPVQTLLANLDSVRYSAEWNRNFFLNSAQPGGAIEVPPGVEMSDRVYERTRTEWAENHRGVNNAHKIAIIEGGKFVNTQFSQKDMQFTELRAVETGTIREAFAIHKHQLGQSDDVNRANAEASDYTFAKGLEVPRLDRIKGTLNNEFLRLFGPSMGTRAGYSFAYRSPVVEDQAAKDATRESKARTYQMLCAAGVHPDDAAEVAGLPVMRRTTLESGMVPYEPAPGSAPASNGNGGRYAVRI